MKKIALLAFSFIAPFSFLAQRDSTKVEQYCQVIAIPRLLSNKVTIDTDFGEEKSYWRDTRPKTCLGKLKKFNTVIDALNFMRKDGWVFLNAYGYRWRTVIYH